MHNTDPFSEKLFLLDLTVHYSGTNPNTRGQADEAGVAKEEV